MNETQRKIIKKRTSYLMHYNHNHDKLGRFASSNYGKGFQNEKKLIGEQEKWYYDINKETITSDRDYAYKKADKYIKKSQNAKDMKKALKYDAKATKIRTKADTLYNKELSSIKSDLDDAKKEAKLALIDIKESYAEDRIKRTIPLEAKKPLYTDQLSGDSTYKITSKEHKCTSLFGDAIAEQFGSEILVTGQSSTKNFKILERSKNGVNLVKTYPTKFYFNDVSSSEYPNSIDKKLLKSYNKTALSQNTRNAILDGRKYLSEKYDKSIAPGATSVHFNHDGKGKTYMDFAYYTDTSGNDEIEVRFDKDRKPYKMTRF